MLKATHLEESRIRKVTFKFMLQFMISTAIVRSFQKCLAQNQSVTFKNGFAQQAKKVVLILTQQSTLLIYYRTQNSLVCFK